MRSRLFVLAACLLALGATGCAFNRQPVMEHGSVKPDPVQPGGQALLTVKVGDPYDIVERVEAVVLEAPRISFTLNDEGREGDKTAGDGIWSRAVDVTEVAPPGSYGVRLTAYRGDGRPVPVRGPETSQSIPLTTTFEVEVISVDTPQ